MENNWTDYPYNESCDIYNPNNELIVTTNDELQFNWICLQIAKNELTGYYILFDGQRYDINIYGEVINRPNNLFNVNEEILTELAICNLDKGYTTVDMCLGNCELYEDVNYEQVVRPDGTIIN